MSTATAGPGARAEVLLAAADAPGTSWPDPIPAAASGWNAADLEALCAALVAGDSAAMMLVRSGQVVFAHGDLAHPFLCHSIRKSFLAVLMGEEVEEGRIRLEATLEQLDIDDLDGLSAIERQATVYDLLTARSGIYHPAGYETDWMRRIKEPRGSHAPGTFWCYNNWDFNALGTVFTQATGNTVGEAFGRRLAGPLGMQDFSLDPAAPGAWVEDFEESRHSAYPFRLSTRDLARFGHLCLRGGVWDGYQIVPPGWIEECVRPYSDAGPRGAYGYMWWRERDGILFPRVGMPPGSYTAYGAGGHFCVVVPLLDLVVVHRVDTDQKDREVSWHAFGALMRLVLRAAPQ